MNIHETEPDENMHENDLDLYRHERSRSRRHREKQCRGAGSKGGERIEDNRGPLNQTGRAKGKGAGQPKKMSTSPADQRNSRGTTTINSDCSDGERQSPDISGEESPMSDGSEKFEDGKKRPRTHKLKNCSNWDNRDRGNGEDDYDNECIRDSRKSYASDYSSKYQCRKERQRAEMGECETQFPVHQEKSERKRGRSSDGEGGRWEPDEGDSA